MDISTEVLNRILSNLSYKVTIIQNSEVVYKNHDREEILTLNQVVDAYFKGDCHALEAIEGYSESILRANDPHKKSVFIKQLIGSKVKTSLVEIHHLLEPDAILYVYEDITYYCTDQYKLQKALRANELIMEMHDIIDQANDLNSMYTLILSKIHTVIPAIRRSCILKINDQKELYIFSSHGYKEDYIETMKVPFERSYAYLNLKGDYSKSVIINDIQEKYKDIHPNVTKYQDGFLHESNISTPLLYNGQLHGILSIDSDINGVFDEEDLMLLNFIKKQVEKAIARVIRLQLVTDESQKDALTGLYNRRYIEGIYHSYVSKSIELGQSFCLAILDLDYLKSTNDTYGHLAGDALIKYFASFLALHTRPYDITARIGGDEFVVLFWDMTADQVLEKMNRWKEEIRHEAIPFDSIQLKINFGYGVASHKQDGFNYDDLLKRADGALYQYKHGRYQQ